MGRLLATIYGGFLVLLGGALQFTMPLAGLVLTIAGAAKMPGSDDTYRDAWAQNVFEVAQGYHSWMQEWGPWLFIVFGFALLAAAYFWKALDEFWRSRFGLSLKLEFEDWVNFPQYNPEPYIVRRSYYNESDRKQLITHSDFYVGVLNNTNNQTIEGVQVKLVYLRAAGAAKNFDHALHTKTNRPTIDINPKTTEYFKLGIAMQENGEDLIGISGQNETIFAQLLEQSKTFAMQLLISARDDATGAINTQPILRNDGNILVLEISGKNVPATFATLRIDGKTRTTMQLDKQTISLISAVKPRKKRRALVDPKAKKKPLRNLLHSMRRYVPRQTS